MHFVVLSAILLSGSFIEATRKIGRQDNSENGQINQNSIEGKKHNVAYGVRQLGKSTSDCIGLYDIPVVFHIIHGTDGKANLTKSDITKQVEELNDGFKDTAFKFTLKDVRWIESDAWVTSCMSSRSTYQQQHAVDTKRTLNVYTCPSGDTDWSSGDASFPWQHPEGDPLDGVIVDSDTLPGGKDPVMNLGKNLIHETGSFFGLFEIFKHGCSAPGDYVSDTPAMREMWGCPDVGEDTCPSQPGLDLVHNYMGAFDDACMSSFTPGQVKRMNENFLHYRPTMADSSSNRPCKLQAIFRWRDGHIYMFASDKYYRYSEDVGGIESGYPKQISFFWTDVPNDVDDVFMDKEKRTYFIKGGNAYLIDGAKGKVASGYPKKISSIWKSLPDTVSACFRYTDDVLYCSQDDELYKIDTGSMTAGRATKIASVFKGAPANINTALAWYNGDIYFFMEQHYYKWSAGTGAGTAKPTSEWWNRDPQFDSYTTFWFCNGLTYFFNGTKYWRFNDDDFQVSAGYAKNISSVWTGVPDNIDAAFVWGCDQNLYIFKCTEYYVFNASSFSVVGGPHQISSFWKGVPNDIDAVFENSNGITYFFKGTEYYRFNDTTRSVDAGYPKPIASFWKGIPDHITSVMRWSNGITYFFKGSSYYRFNDTTTSVDPGYPLSISKWKGVLHDL